MLFEEPKNLGPRSKSKKTEKLAYEPGEKNISACHIACHPPGTPPSTGPNTRTDNKMRLWITSKSLILVDNIGVLTVLNILDGVPVFSGAQKIRQAAHCPCGQISSMLRDRTKCLEQKFEQF